MRQFGVSSLMTTCLVKTAPGKETWQGKVVEFRLLQVLFCELGARESYRLCSPDFLMNEHSCEHPCYVWHRSVSTCDRGHELYGTDRRNSPGYKDCGFDSSARLAFIRLALDARGPLML